MLLATNTTASCSNYLNRGFCRQGSGFNGDTVALINDVVTGVDAALFGITEARARHINKLAINAHNGLSMDNFIRSPPLMSIMSIVKTKRLALEAKKATEAAFLCFPKVLFTDFLSNSFKRS
jgi:hypothetical protein